jgi:polyisoprenoid-binding protein YceI
VTARISLTYLKDKFGMRVNKRDLKSDKLVVRVHLTIKRRDFGINPRAQEDKVSDTIDLASSIAGAAPQK